AGWLKNLHSRENGAAKLTEPTAPDVNTKRNVNSSNNVNRNGPKLKKQSTPSTPPTSSTPKDENVPSNVTNTSSMDIGNNIHEYPHTLLERTRSGGAPLERTRSDGQQSNSRR